jgi:hypothetical protein
MNIHEAQANYSEKAAGILREWHETLDEITRSHEPVEGEYLERLTDTQREQLLREQKAERAHAERENYVRQYRELTEEHHEQVKKRTRFLGERLFKVEDAGALARAALATDTQLGTLMELAAQSGNAELGRAAFVAAEQRGLGELIAAFFDRIDPEARELYEEFKAAPSEEIMQRREAGVETIIPPLDSSRFATVPTFGAY